MNVLIRVAAQEMHPFEVAFFAACSGSSSCSRGSSGAGAGSSSVPACDGLPRGALQHQMA